MRQLFLCGCACVLVALVAVLVNVFSQSMRAQEFRSPRQPSRVVVLAATNVKKKDVLILFTPYTRNVERGRLERRPHMPVRAAMAL